MKMTRSESGKLGAIASKEHKRLLKQNNIENYNLSPRHCKECKIDLQYKQRKNHFCSHSCGAIYSNRVNPRFNTGPKSKKYCRICNKSHQMMIGDLCKKHYSDHKFEQGLMSDRSTLKKWLIKTKGYSCKNCHGTIWQNKPMPLEVDHIDGNAGDNTPQNIRLLCPNCHALMPTSKGGNRGHGRKARGLALH